MPATASLSHLFRASLSVVAGIASGFILDELLEEEYPVALLLIFCIELLLVGSVIDTELRRYLFGEWSLGNLILGSATGTHSGKEVPLEESAHYWYLVITGVTQMIISLLFFLVLRFSVILFKELQVSEQIAFDESIAGLIGVLIISFTAIESLIRINL